MFTTVLRKNEIVEVSGPARILLLERSSCRAGGGSVKIGIEAPPTTKITVGPKGPDIEKPNNKQSS